MQVHALEGEFHKLQQSRSQSRSPPPSAARPSPTSYPARATDRPTPMERYTDHHSDRHSERHTDRPHPAGTVGRETGALSAEERMVRGGGRGHSAAQDTVNATERHTERHMERYTQRDTERHSAEKENTHGGGYAAPGWVLESMQPRTPSHYTVGPSADGARGRMLNVGNGAVDRLKGTPAAILSPNTRWAQAM